MELLKYQENSFGMIMLSILITFHIRRRNFILVTFGALMGQATKNKKLISGNCLHRIQIRSRVKKIYLVLQKQVMFLTLLMSFEDVMESVSDSRPGDQETDPPPPPHPGPPVIQ